VTLRIDANGESIFDYEHPCEYEVKVEKVSVCVSGTPDKPIIDKCMCYFFTIESSKFKNIPGKKALLGHGMTFAYGSTG
jgi:hypothetical protein